MYYDPTKVVNWAAVLGGRAGWAFLASLIFHRHARSYYDLIISSVVQRRLFRMRTAVVEAMKVSLNLLLRVLVYALVLWLVLQLFITPVSYLLIGGNSRRNEASGEQNRSDAERLNQSQGSNHQHHQHQQYTHETGSNNANAAGGKSDESSSNSNTHVTPSSPQPSSSSSSSKPGDMSNFLRPRHKQVNARFLVSSFSRFVLNSSTFILWNMNIMSIGELFLRLFELLATSFVLEMTWLISSIIFSERFSFLDFEDHSSSRKTSSRRRPGISSSSQHRSLLKSKKGDSDHLLKSNKSSHSSSLSSVIGSDLSSAAVLIKCLESSAPFISSLALIDLHYISYHTPEMRSEIYQVSSSNDSKGSKGNAASSNSASISSQWDHLAEFAISKLDFTSNIIQRALAKANDSSSKQMKGDSKQKSKSIDSSGSSISQMVQKALSILLTYRKSFDKRIRETFKWARRDLVDLSLESSLSTFVSSPSMVQHQMEVIFLLKSVSRLIKHSVKEDESGTIASSKTIPDILNAMLNLHLTLQDYAEYAASNATIGVGVVGGRIINPEKNVLNGHSLSFSFSSSLLATISESIYEITTTYYEHLMLYQFSQDHLAILQKYMDFSAN
jgi:hypothetical protein